MVLGLPWISVSSRQQEMEHVLSDVLSMSSPLEPPVYWGRRHLSFRAPASPHLWFNFL